MREVIRLVFPSLPARLASCATPKVSTSRLDTRDKVHYRDRYDEATGYESAYFRGRIDQHVNGMFARPVPRPSNVKTIVGDVTDRVIIVTMLDGTKYFWEGGKYASRKVNLCYAPLMPKPVDVPLKYKDGHTLHTDDCMSEWGEARRYTLPLTPETIAANHALHMHDVNHPRHGLHCQVCGFRGEVTWNRQDSETFTVDCPDCGLTHAVNFA
jgi:hypothetical protein